MDRRALLARARRRAFFPLVAATAVLIYAWIGVDPTNCPPGSPDRYCLVFGHPRPLIWTLGAVPVAAAALALAVAVPASWTRRLPDAEFLQRYPRSLPLVVGVSAAYAPWLFWGELVASQWLWLALAVPFAPYLGGFVLFEAGLSDSLSRGLPAALLVLFVLAVLQAAGYYGLARGIDRAAGYVRNFLTSQTNSSRV